LWLLPSTNSDEADTHNMSVSSSSLLVGGSEMEQVGAADSVMPVRCGQLGAANSAQLYAGDSAWGHFGTLLVTET